MLQVNHIVNSIFTSRTYILSNNSNDYWIVDCGDVAPLIKLISGLNEGDSFDLKGVLLTHAHYDHIYGLNYLTELFPDLKVYTNEYGKKALANEKINMSKYHEDPINYKSENVIECTEGYKINLFYGIDALVHFTPGHNPSCLTYEIDNYLFTGDAYIPGVEVVTILPNSNKSQAKESVDRIKALALGKTICPGHELNHDDQNELTYSL